MPIKYGIKVKTDKVISESYYYGKEYEEVVHLTPKDYAEEHKKGVKQLLTAAGKPLTDWVPIQRTQGNIDALKAKSKAPSLPDFMGEQLVVGDYVTFSVKRHTELLVGEVIGFGKQGKVRIMPFDDYEQLNGVLSFPDAVVKIPYELLGTDPNSEWIPTEEEIVNANQIRN